MVLVVAQMDLCSARTIRAPTMMALVGTLDSFATSSKGLVVASEVLGAAEEGSAATRKDLDVSMKGLAASLRRRLVSYVFFGPCLSSQWLSSEALLASS